MVKVVIDNKEVDVPKGSTILQVCLSLGIDLPRFCFHHELSVAGNCRMCLVEVEKSAKPVAACAMGVMEGMRVKTNSRLVKLAREGVLEFLLVNHPLDCPICDQGGECDLQDLTYVYGNDKGRFIEKKRAVLDKDFGPFIKTIMTRCIHCTRCVRFLKEVSSNTSDLGTTGRGGSMEIGTYIKKGLKSPLSGNIIDLCPVGALTSKPYSYKARSWELESLSSIDVFDGLGSNIRVDYRGDVVMRVLPRLNSKINKEWITDKVRFSFDGLYRQRLVMPLIKSLCGSYSEISWKSALKEITNRAIFRRSEILLGSQIEAETILGMLRYQMLLEDIYQLKGRSVSEGTVNVQNLDWQSSYLFGTPFKALSDKVIDFVLFVGCDLSKDGPILETFVKDIDTYSVGSLNDLKGRTLGDTVEVLLRILKGCHPICQKMFSCKKPIIVVSNDLSFEVKVLLSKIQKVFNKVQQKVFLNSSFLEINYLHNRSNGVTLYELGVRGEDGLDLDSFYSQKFDFSYLVGEVIKNNDQEKEESYRVMQNHHVGYPSLLNLDLILPGSTFFEKKGTFVNTQGFVQKIVKAVTAPGISKEDSVISLNLINNLISKKEVSRIDEEDLRQNLKKESPIFSFVEDSKFTFMILNSFDGVDSLIDGAICIDSNNWYPICSLVDNYFMTDGITRASKVMADRSGMFI